MATIAQNRKAYHDYEIIEKVEAGIMLGGTEVKSIRAGRVNLADSYAACERGEIYLYRLHISLYDYGALSNHEPYRKRKLLLHERQIRELCSQVERSQLTLVPLQLYFKKQWVKIELGLCRGRKKYDKREKIASQDSKRRLNQMVRSAKNR